MKWFTETNAKSLVSSGIPISLLSLRAAHNQGDAVAIKIFKANKENPETKVMDLLPGSNARRMATMNVNHWSHTMTVSEYLQDLENQGYSNEPIRDINISAITREGRQLKPL
jgi:hypothetical protein